MNWRKSLVSLLILSFAMSIYQLWFQPSYNQWLIGQGRSLGVAESAGGYFMAGILTLLITWFVTKKMGEKGE